MSWDDIKTVDTSNIIEKLNEEGTLLENRRKINNRYNTDIQITIMVLAYNRLEKTKACIESIMKYTLNHKFKLLLVDNGSNDGTFEYFKDLQFSPKEIIRITENKGANLGVDIAYKYFDTKYIAVVTNDIIVTANWMDNFLACLESDERIGEVNPLVSNSSKSYLEELPEFSTIEEAEEYGKQHNMSNPRLWAERVRCPSLCYMLRKEVIDLIGGADIGFFHEFAEDDFQIRMRRTGYKLFLLEDTFVHHNHYMQERDLEKSQRTMQGGYNNYIEKYHGLEPWRDTDFFVYPFIKNMQCRAEEPKILGIDTRCGQPILDIENRFRREEIEVNPNNVFAYTQEAKYYDMLRIITPNVICDNRINYVSRYYEKESFDTIVIGEDINRYERPLELLEDILKLLKKGGSLIVFVYNMFDFHTLFGSIIEPMWRNKNNYVQIHYRDILEKLEIEQVEYVQIFDILYGIRDELLNNIKSVNDVLAQFETDPEITLAGLLTERYCFCIRK